MKKTFFTICFLLVTCCVYAQESDEEINADLVSDYIYSNSPSPKYDENFLFKNELSASYGMVTSTEIIDVFTNIFGTLFFIKSPNSTYSGAFSLQYIRNFNRTVGFGAIVNYENITRKGDSWILETKEVVNNQKISKTTKGNSDIKEYNHYFTIMPTAKIRWFNLKCFGMYSKIAAGFTIGERKQKISDYQESEEDTPRLKTENESMTEFSFQLSPVCLEVGVPRVRAFAEFGFGCQGVANFGLRCGF